MKIIDVMQAKLAQHKLGYINLIRWLVWTVWSMLTKPGAFDFEGQRVENVLANGSLRILLGGFGMVAVGLLLAVLGLVSSLLILVLLLLSPIWAGLLMIWARYKHREIYRLMGAMVESAKEKRRHE
jgi:hypothetical protein